VNQRPLRPVKELLILIFLMILFIFAPLRAFRIFIMALFLYRGIAMAACLIIPRYLTVEIAQRPYFATMHKSFEQTVLLQNSSLLPVPQFILEASCNGLFFIGPSISVQPINGKGSRKLSFQIVGDSRGRHNWGPFTLRGTDPLHLFQWEKKIDCVRPVILYPTVFSMNLTISKGLTGGALPVQNRIYENLNSFQALRKYQPGDELKRINWKATARLGELYSNIYDCALYFPVQIVLNLAEQQYPLSNRSELAERAIATAASLTLHFLGLKQAVGLLSSGQRSDQQDKEIRWIPAGSEEDQSAVILEELAASRINKEGTPLQELLKDSRFQGSRGCKYLIVTPPLLSEDLYFLQEQKRSGRDIELYMVSGLKTHRKQMAHPGIPCYILHPNGGAPVREQ